MGTAAGTVPSTSIPTIQSDQVLAPVTPSERIAAIDAVRGFAVLGILLMNIVAMGLVGPAYDNPTIAGGSTGANLAVWAFLHVTAEGKMRALFSLVFGASMILLTKRLDRRGDGADIYYRRTLWLMAFGIAHAYLLWLGDILFPYALCAFVLYPFRKMKSKALLIIGGVILAVTAIAYIGYGMDIRETITKGREAEAVAAAGVKLTDEQQEARKKYEDWRKFNAPTPAEVEKKNEKWRGSAVDVLKARAEVVGFFHSLPYYHPWNWDIWGMMFLGMGLMKAGLFNAQQRPIGFYLRIALIAYAIGIPLNTFSAYRVIQSGFDPAFQQIMHVTYDLGRLTVALGHLGMVIVLCKLPWMNWLTKRLEAVGQIAFTNYIFQSVVTAFLFTGHGLGLFGTLQRYQLYYVVGAIWIVQLLVSPLWVQHFRFGPMEWLWRSLTYWKRQPMRLSAAPATVAGAAAATAD